MIQKLKNDKNRDDSLLFQTAVIKRAILWNSLRDYVSFSSLPKFKCTVLNG